MSGIALVIGDLSEGGAQRVVTTLAAGWLARNRKVTIITLSGPESDFFQPPAGVDRLIVGGSGGSGGLIMAIRANFLRVRGLRQAIRDSGATTVISFVGTTNVLSVLACRGLRVQLAISERNDPARQSLGHIWDFMRRRYYKKADQVTANSRGALDTLLRFVPPEKLVLVYNPLATPPDNFRHLPEKLILNVGRLNAQKAQDVLIRAFADLIDSFPDWSLAIVGSGALEQNLKSLTSQLGIADKVIFPGQVNPWDWYAKAAVFALPSRFEGTPNALLEAMSVGLPSIVSNASEGPLTYVSHNQSGLVVPPDDVEELKTALQKLMSNTNLRSRIGANACNSVQVCEQQKVLDAWEKSLGISSA